MKYTIVIFSILGAYFIAFLIHKYLHLLKIQKKAPLFVWKAKSTLRPEIIEGDKFPESTAPFEDGYSMNFWLWLDNVNINNPKQNFWKHILHKGDPLAEYTQPGIWLHPNTNKIFIFFDLKQRVSHYKPIQHNKFLKDNLDIHENIKLGNLKNLCNKDSSCTGISYLCTSSTDPCAKCKYGWLKKDDNIKLINTPESINKEKLMKIIDMGYDDVGTIIKQKNKPSMNPNMNKDMIYEKYVTNVIDNVPIGRWFQLSIVVNSTLTTVYIDGLVKSTIPIKSQVKLNNNNLYVNTLNGGFSGLIAQIKYFPYPISQDKIANIYSWGPQPWQLPDVTKFNLKLRKCLTKGKKIEIINGKKIFNFFNYKKKDSKEECEPIRFYRHGNLTKNNDCNNPLKYQLNIKVYKVDFENLSHPEPLLDVDPLKVNYKYFPSYDEMISFINIEKNKYEQKCKLLKIDYSIEQLCKKIDDILPPCYKNMIQCNPNDQDIITSDSCNKVTNGTEKKKNLWTKNLLTLLLNDMKKNYQCNDGYYGENDDTKGIDLCPKDDVPPPVSFPKPVPKPLPPTPFQTLPPITTSLPPSPITTSISPSPIISSPAPAPITPKNVWDLNCAGRILNYNDCKNIGTKYQNTTYTTEKKDNEFKVKGFKGEDNSPVLPRGCYINIDKTSSRRGDIKYNAYDGPKYASCGMKNGECITEQICEKHPKPPPPAPPPTLPAIMGCDGIPNSGKVPDLCGECGGQNEKCKGCDGVPNSGLELDACGICGGQGLCLGCDGVPNSRKKKDKCGICGGNNKDEDECGVCFGNNKDKDDCGVCFGNNKNKDDCGECFGNNRNKDICGECGGDGTKCLGCDGKPYSRKKIDQCGICGGFNDCIGCDGVPNSRKKKDKCGICGGNNACIGCDGKIDSGKVVDQCGVCGGNNKDKDDCGVCFGNNKDKDDCGVCFGNNKDKDDCGECFGNNRNKDECGICFGNNRNKDNCGVCGGNNKKSCFERSTRDICLNTECKDLNNKECDWTPEGLRVTGWRCVPKQPPPTCKDQGKCESDADCPFPQNEYCERQGIRNTLPCGTCTEKDCIKWRQEQRIVTNTDRCPPRTPTHCKGVVCDVQPAPPPRRRQTCQDQGKCKDSSDCKIPDQHCVMGVRQECGTCENYDCRDWTRDNNIDPFAPCPPNTPSQCNNGSWCGKEQSTPPPPPPPAATGCKGWAIGRPNTTCEIDADCDRPFTCQGYMGPGNCGTCRVLAPNLREFNAQGIWIGNQQQQQQPQRGFAGLGGVGVRMGGLQPDKKPECPTWAQLGECTRATQFMRENCATSCDGKF